MLELLCLHGASAGHDVRDSTSSSRPVPSFSQALEPSTSGSSTDYASSRPLQGKRMALIKETLGEGVEPQVQAAIMQAAKHYESLGAVVEEVSLPSFRLGLPAYYVLAVSEASSNLARYDGVRFGSRNKDAAELQAMYEASRELGLGGEVKRRIMMGTYALSAGYYDAYYKRAQQVRTIIASEMEGALQQYDGLLCPAAPTLAYRFGEKAKDPLSMYKGDVCTVNVNMAGLPAVVLPCGFADQASHPGSPQLPVGLQVVGRAFDEAGILQLAHAYEQTRSAENWPTLAFPALP
ncbi:amidase signature domain-containing protein [Dunaliella salina]|uniref:Amidase signature domain-containing protein n=1 Tax=Dunaliella salina TaxID=3046 RepID=A0ABQ7G9D2_DUNSA|nr:amidase signature domain-containing protein [Dunaliella salina]|eukprot:KAF5831176.1 amidase signature domain-containing protein [Dunaliella salina]